MLRTAQQLHGEGVHQPGRLVGQAVSLQEAQTHQIVTLGHQQPEQRPTYSFEQAMANTNNAKGLHC